MKEIPWRKKMKINSVDFVSSLSDSQSICFLNALSCGWYPFGKQFINPNKCCLRNERYTANVNSRITDKIRYLSVVFKQTHLFLDIFESCYNHRQMSVKIKIKSHIQQKN